MNSPPSSNPDNPLLHEQDPPPFTEIKAEHVVPAIRQLIEQAQKGLEQLEAEVRPTFAGTVEAVRKIEHPLMHAWNVTHHLLSVRNEQDLRTAQEEVQPEVVAFAIRSGQSRPVFDALKELRDSAEGEKLSPAQSRIVEKHLQGMELSGIGLAGAERERFNEIQTELADLSTQYSNAVLDSTEAFELVLTEREAVDGLPPSVLRMTAQSARDHGHPDASENDGPWRITLEHPVLIPVLKHARKAELREQLYRAHISLASQGEWDNTQRVESILELRREQSRLLGFETYAEMSLSRKMAPSVAAVDKLQHEIREVVMDYARRDLGELRDFARDATGDTGCELRHWDAAFYAERLHEQRFDYSEEELKPYFAFPRVLEGLFDLARKMFDVEVVAADGEVQVWHPDVRFFRVKNAGSDAPIASFFLDAYSRPGLKRAGAWMQDLVDRERLEDGSVRLPTAVICCNQSPPVDDEPSLMTFRDVETLFHEFGHSLQHMLSVVDYPEVAGTSGVEWDAVELPSQFMENWCTHRDTLMGLSGHVKTGERLPDDLFEKVVQSKNFRSGSNMLRQIYLGQLDLEIHHRLDLSGDRSVLEAQREVAAVNSVMPPLPEDRQLCSFSHLFAGGYAAGYYSYQWAEVLSADAFSAFEEAGLEDPEAVRETGHRFRDTVLALGGSVHPMEVFQRFRGREPSTDALLRHNGLRPLQTQSG